MHYTKMESSIKRAITGACALLLLGTGFIWVVFPALQLKLWERNLQGPYMGLPYPVGSLGNPDSRMQLGVYSLDLYNGIEPRGPVLTLRRPNGEAAWGYLLCPENASQNKEAAWHISELRFQRLVVSKGRSKVYVGCTWDRGGAEGGIIYVGTNFSFEGIALSW